MKLWEGIALGIIQWLTELLPVSSSGHLVIAQSLMTDFHQPGVLFDVMLLVTGLLLFLSDGVKNAERNGEQMNVTDSIVIGLVQGIAVIPGICRSLPPGPGRTPVIDGKELVP